MFAGIILHLWTLSLGHWLVSSSGGHCSAADLSADGFLPTGNLKSIHISSSVTSLWADSISFLVNSGMISFNLLQIPPAVSDHFDSWETSFFFFSLSLPPSRFGRMLPLVILHHFSPPSNNPISVPWVGWIPASRAPCKTSHVTKHGLIRNPTWQEVFLFFGNAHLLTDAEALRCLGRVHIGQKVTDQTQIHKRLPVWVDDMKCSNTAAADTLMIEWIHVFMCVLCTYVQCSWFYRTGLHFIQIPPIKKQNLGQKMFTIKFPDVAKNSYHWKKMQYKSGKRNYRKNKSSRLCNLKSLASKCLILNHNFTDY